jgi:RloB-like protein
MARVVRQQRTTVLIACEGHAEEVFLNHIRSTFLHREGNTALTIKNAHGKAARHVLKQAIACLSRQAYDRVAITYDTDDDLSLQEHRHAQAKRIVLLPSSPCFEATLLQLLKQQPPTTTKECKAAFEQIMGWPAHDPRTLQHDAFSKLNIATMQEKIDMISRLFVLLGQSPTATTTALRADGIHLDGAARDWTGEGRD